MKKITFILLICFIALSINANASTWCPDDGNGHSLQQACLVADAVFPDGNERIKLPNGKPISGNSNINGFGYYKVVDVWPALNEGYMYSGYTETFKNNEFLHTHNQILKPAAPTVDEINAAKISDEGWNIIKPFLEKNIMFPSDFPNLQEAIEARQTLEAK